ncbi:MAG: thioesterase family protein [Gemmobacter sp.]
MYPIFRFAAELLRVRRMPPCGLLDAHVSHHICLPFDIDPWRELNNGRTLTLYDLGRVPFALRCGLAAALRKSGWGMTVAGVSVRYRRRIRAFDRFTTVTRCLGWDARFIYLEQSMWRRGECTNQMLLRSAITDGKGIVAPARLLEAMDHPTESPALPGWAAAWIAAETGRPWPPEAGRFL